MLAVAARTPPEPSPVAPSVTRPGDDHAAVADRRPAEHQPPVPANVPPRSITSPATLAGDDEAFAGMSEADRERWMAARNSIRVTAAGWTAKKAYVVIDGRFIVLGSVYKFQHEGTNYAFSLYSVTEQRKCKWMPVPKLAAAESVDFTPF